MTAPDPALHVNIGVMVVKDHPSGQPVIAAVFPMGGAKFVWELAAKDVPNTLAGLNNAMLAAAQDAIAQAGPQLITPPSTGLLLPNGVKPTQNGKHP